MPSLELAKGVGVAVSAAVAHGEGVATDTVHHGHPVGSMVCIALDADSTVADIVPALQAELKDRGVDSRVYDGPAPQGQCPVWLNYAVSIEWDVPTFQSAPQSYMSAAQLVLRRPDGQVLSSSRYGVGTLGLSKWSSTRRKIGPVVQALLTGFPR